MPAAARRADGRRPGGPRLRRPGRGRGGDDEGPAGRDPGPVGPTVRQRARAGPPLGAGAAAGWIPVILHGGRATGRGADRGARARGLRRARAGPGAAELLARLGAALRLRGLMDRLEQQAYRDSLTGLINRGAAGGPAPPPLGGVAAARDEPVGPVDRPGPIQADQRHLGHPGRRRGPAPDGGRADAMGAGQRHRRPLRRRRVRGRRAQVPAGRRPWSWPPASAPGSPPGPMCRPPPPGVASDAITLSIGIAGNDGPAPSDRRPAPPGRPGPLHGQALRPRRGGHARPVPRRADAGRPHRDAGRALRRTDRAESVDRALIC